MIRGFGTGLVWGGIVAGAGLAVISQVAPLPRPVEPEVAATSAPQVQDAPVIVGEPPAVAIAEDPGGLPDAVNDALPDALPETAIQSPDAEPAPAGDSVAEPPLVAQDVAPDRVATPDVSLTAPEAPVPQTGDLPSILPLPSVPPLSGDSAPETVEPPPVIADAPSEPLLEKAPELPEPPAATGGAAIIALDPVPTLPEAPSLIVPDSRPLTERQQPPTADALPRIGDGTEEVVALPAATTPLDLFSRPFDNADGKPLFALVLIDDGAPDLDRETLAALPFPVTFVVDPLLPDVAAIAAVYRNAGQEVMIQTTGVPKGAKPADIEQSYQAMDIAVPEAVAVLGAAGLEEDNRALAAAVAPILVAQGRGILTMERGLNAVDQAARREGVPQATAFRMLDAAGESVPVIRRYLDRAAFRAAQEGSVVVLGSTRPDTIAAILQWNVEGRAASVALAPISAVLRKEN
ncbi:divergent polysaccharide deacetylase family protein [Paragemmobacter aquarius]|uniref:divergent polysaccharide deacetylase family protein n=1 Tax=Paragemmobacter aquarius TaxID=2169400 RepID=UPI00131F00FF|nr:divergent polysaccharide deacetylase family protein [Gemmobacter aquarius]